jgi:hypothetical protein
MQTRRFAVIAIATLVPASMALTGCATGGSRAEVRKKVDTLASWMAGTYTSEAQASTDPDNFFNVRLIMTPIWPERSDGRWLYVEQAMATALDKPYRQRIYQVTAEGKGFESTVYTLPGNPLEYAGAWQDPSKFDSMTPQMLTEREGCEIMLTWDEAGQRFVGATVEKNCPSDLRGASYATSEVSITPTGLTSWDRGFDASGTQVWGAKMGGYQFVKVSK